MIPSRAESTCKSIGSRAYYFVKRTNKPSSNIQSTQAYIAFGGHSTDSIGTSNKPRDQRYRSFPTGYQDKSNVMEEMTLTKCNDLTNSQMKKMLGWFEHKFSVVVHGQPEFRAFNNRFENVTRKKYPPYNSQEPPKPLK